MKSAFSVLCPKVSLLVSYANVTARTPAKSPHVLPGLIVNEHDSAGPRSGVPAPMGGMATSALSLPGGPVTASLGRGLPLGPEQAEGKLCV